MNQSYKTFFKNTSYTFLANIISLVISAVAILIIPRRFGVEDYGYFQLYLFYSSYVGFFHLGWSDGLYLRYGGKDYKEIDEDVIRTQLWLMVLFLLMCSIVTWCAFSQVIEAKNKLAILEFAVICALIIIPRSLIWLLLQALGEIVNYAKFTIIEKIIYIFLIILIMIFNINDYKLLIIADLIGKGISFICTCQRYPKFVLGKCIKLREAAGEIKENICVGSKLMLANIASMLVIGVVRVGIESNWGIAIFGKVSLTISICNFLLVFINAIGMVLFPMLKRISMDQLIEIYKIMELLVSCILFLALSLFFPFKGVLISWLPQYSDSLYYMMFLFPVCIFESKMSLIYNTYLKTLRQEKKNMKINIYTVILSIVLTFFNIKIFNNLTLMISSILLLLWFRYVLSQISVAHILKIYGYKTLITDSLFSGAFILISYFVTNGIKAFLIYSLMLFVYFYYERKRLYMLLNLMCKSNL